MTLPNVRVVRLNGALKLAPAAVDGIVAVIGPSSKSPPPAFYTDATALVAAAGVGPGVDDAAGIIADVGGALFVSQGGVAGALGAVTGAPSLALTGAPADAYRIRVTVTAIGATTSVAWSKDGGANWTNAVGIGASTALGDTGITLGIVGAAHPVAVGDSIASDCDAPYLATGDFATAAAALDAMRADFGTLLVSGMAHGADDATKAASCAAMVAAVETYMASRDASKRWARAVVNAPFVAPSALVTAFANIFAEHVQLVGSPIDVVSEADKLTYKRPAGAVYAGRIASLPVHKHPGEYLQGPLPGRVSALYTSDADATTLDNARIVTLRTFPNDPGFYITRGPTLAAPGSDYFEIQFARVIDLASRGLYRFGLPYLNRDLDVTSRSSGTAPNIIPAGALQEPQAKAIDEDVTKRLVALIGRYVSGGVAVTANRTNVIDSDGLALGARFTPKGYAREVDISVGFTASS